MKGYLVSYLTGQYGENVQKTGTQQRVWIEADTQSEADQIVRKIDQNAVITSIVGDGYGKPVEINPGSLLWIIKKNERGT